MEKEVKKLRRIAGGDTFTIIYLKLMLLSLKSDGRLYFDGVEDTFHEELALEIDEDPENVRVTILYLEKMGLLQVLQEDEMYLTQMDSLILSESESAQRVRKHRANQKMLQCNAPVTDGNAIETNSNTYTDTYTDTDINTEKKKKKKEHQQEVDEFFETMWNLYIRKEGKSAVTKKAKEEIFSIGYERMKKCIERYNNKVSDSEPKYRLMGSTFFNGRYKDYLENEVKPTTKQEEPSEPKMTEADYIKQLEAEGVTFVN